MNVVYLPIDGIQVDLSDCKVEYTLLQIELKLFELYIYEKTDSECFFVPVSGYSV